MTADIDPLLFAEVRSLISRVAYLADYGEVVEYLDNLTADAVWTVPASDSDDGIRDRAAIEAGIAHRRGEKRQGPGSHTRHVVSIVDVGTGDGGSITAVSYYTLYRRTDTEPVIVSMGRYYDELRREDGRLRIARRTARRG
jgi:3-phenylpropionate/cinnamic acid dioxygenase small subunit